MNYSIGFTTTEGVCLDLDYITQEKADKRAVHLLERYKLEGYLLIESSPDHYHVVFNRYTDWRETTQIVFSTFKAIEWGIWQARKGELTLRLSEKNGKNIPQLIKCVGKTDKLIKDYLKMYKGYLEIFHPEFETPSLLKELQLEDSTQIDHP